MRRSPSSFALTLAAAVVVASCRREDAVPSRVRAIESDASTETAESHAADVAFVARDGELVARLPDHAVHARETATQFDAARGRLLTLGRTRANRGRSMSVVAGRAERGSDGGVVRVMGSAIEERLVAHPVGTEQSWRLSERPTGQGDLRVEVSVSDAEFLGSDGRGLRFAGVGGEIVYSHATFVEASGERHPIAAGFHDGAIVLVVPAGLLDTATYPAVLDPTISPLLTIGGISVDVCPAFGDQRDSSFAAMTPNVGLVAYVDLADPAGSTLDAVFVDATGSALGAPIRLASGVTDVPTETACDATTCLVVYTASGSLRAVRVDANGNLLDSPALTLGSVGSLATIASESTSTGFAVAWSDRGTSTGTTFAIRATRVSSSGVVSPASPLTLGTTSSLPIVGVATLSGVSLVAWDDVNGSIGGIRGSRIDASGVVLDSPAVMLVDVPGIDGSPALVTRGNEVLLVYHSDSDIRGTSFSLTSPLTIPPSVEILWAGFVPRPTAIALSDDGTTTSLAWVTGYTPPSISSATIPTPLGTATSQGLTGNSTLVSTLDVESMASGRIASASIVRDYMFEVGTNGSDVQMLRPATKERNLTIGESSVTRPSATYLPTQFGVEFLIDQAHATSAVGISRISTSGTLLDSTPFVAATGSFTSSVQSGFAKVDLAYYGSKYMLTWSTRQRSSPTNGFYGYAYVMSADQSVPIGFSTTRVSYTFTDFALTGGPTQAWMFGFSNGDIWSMSWNESTTGLASGVANTTGYSRIRSDGNRAIAWRPSGFVSLTPATTTGAVTATTIVDDGGLGIAYGTRSSIVVRRNGTAGTATGVVGTLLGLNGVSTIVANIAVTSGATPVGEPRVIFDGTNYDVFFVRDRAVQLVRVDEDGVVRDLVPSTVATGATADGRPPALASNRAGKVVVAFEYFDPTPGIRAMRIGAKLIDWNGTGSGAPNGVACASVLDCATGFCVDGVCCDSACGSGAANDCQACSTAAHGTGPNGTCSPTDTTVTCRGSVGVCDPIETCDGTTTVCPGDLRAPAGTLCGTLSASPCETDQTCNGSSALCQAKAPAQGNPVCRDSTGPCDAEERCTGSSTACPADVLRGSSYECRSSAGGCDAAERCTGGSASCPDDVPANVGTVCRGLAGVCDTVETCDGSSFTCPNDQVAGAGLPCRAVADACDVAEACDGSSPLCPTNAFAPSSTVCRAVSGICDLEERCTGLAAACPLIDAMKPAGATCRGARDLCDAAEVCDGVSNGCPSDGFLPTGTICRGADGICDSAEACSGLGVACPLDRNRIDGSGCGDGLLCDGAEVCVGGACVAGEALVCEASSPCLESTGECAVSTRPGGAAGCSMTPRGQSPPWIALIALGILVVLRRTSRARHVSAAVLVVATMAGCVCGVGAVPCDDSCVDLGYDERNCGACGVTCGTGQCIEGACVSNVGSGLTCTNDGVCLDGNTCNGVERCIEGVCRGGDAITCDDGLGCTADRCDADRGSCVSVPNGAACGRTP